MRHVYNDGGRAAAGYKGTAGDCVVRAIAIATNKPYQEVFDALKLLAQKERPRGRRKRSSVRDGCAKQTAARYLASLEWTWHPTMQIGSGCKVHMRQDELPNGRIVVSLSRHFAAVIDGILYDNHDCSRGGTRCVYGYWRDDDDPFGDEPPTE